MAINWHTLEALVEAASDAIGDSDFDTAWTKLGQIEVQKLALPDVERNRFSAKFGRQIDGMIRLLERIEGRSSYGASYIRKYPRPVRGCV